jgi:hypothetical protein
MIDKGKSRMMRAAWLALAVSVAASGAAPAQRVEAKAQRAQAAAVELEKLQGAQVRQLPDTQLILGERGQKMTLGEARSKWAAQHKQAVQSLSAAGAKLGGAMQAQLAKRLQEQQAALQAQHAQYQAELAKLKAAAGPATR